MVKKKKLIAAAGLNLLIAAMEAVSLLNEFLASGDRMFVYYTEDSNIFAFAAALAAAVFELRYLIKGKTVPRGIAFVKYAAACCVAVTFIVVVLILSPMDGKGADSFRVMLFSGNLLYHHTLCPLLMVFSFLLFERELTLPMKAAMYALIPTAVYGAVLIVLNLCRVVEGPYPFLRVCDQPVYMSVIWAILIVGGAYLIAWGMKKLHGKQ